MHHFSLPRDNSNKLQPKGKRYLWLALACGLGLVLICLICSRAWYVVTNLGLVKAAHDGNLTAVRFLVRAGADPNTQEDETGPPLLAAAEGRNLEVARFLIVHGADIDGRGAFDATPLLACVGDDTRLAEFLLDQGAQVDAKDYQGNTLLVSAAANGNLNLTRILTAHKADVNVRGRGGRTPLMQAASVDYTVDNAALKGVVRTLLRSGADVTLKDEDGETALSLARRYDHRDLAELLQRASPPSHLPTIPSLF